MRGLEIRFSEGGRISEDVCPLPPLVLVVVPVCMGGFSVDGFVFWDLCFVFRD